MKSASSIKIGIGSLIAFVLFTISLCFIDVQPVGPQSTLVGYATVNLAVHQFIGIHHIWYTVTDWLGLVAILTAGIFALTGLYQLIRRKSLFLVDRQILILGAMYLIIIGSYLFFEKVIINYRPVILSSSLEASYPSSHTMIVTSVLGTTIILLHQYFSAGFVRSFLTLLCGTVICVTIAGRLIAGVHWCTDILGGILLSLSIISIYKGLCNHGV